MSIIHNALKKTQNQMHDSKTPEPNNESSPSPSNIYEKMRKTEEERLAQKPQKSNSEHPSPHQKPPAKNRDRAPSKDNEPRSSAKIWLILGAVLILMITGNLLHENGFINTNFQTQSRNDPRVNYKSKPFVIKDGQYEISGTMMMGDQRIILINDVIYEVGDDVDGNIIKDISVNELVLQSPDGKIERITLEN
jgi:hypothetical protein